MTYMALEMLCLLVLNQDLLIFELPLAIEAPNPERLLLLLPHYKTFRLRGSLDRLSGFLKTQTGILQNVRCPATCKTGSTSFYNTAAFGSLLEPLFMSTLHSLRPSPPPDIAARGLNILSFQYERCPHSVSW
jgi:hypothetical protein